MRRLDRMNPIAMTVYFMCAAFICLVRQDAVLLALFLSGAVSTFFLYGKQKGGHVFSLLLFFGLALINPLVSHKGVTVLFVMNHNPVTLEALLYGFFAGGMIVSSLYWFRTYSQLMTSDKLLYLFGALSPKLSLVLSMAMRYVPLFGQQVRKVHEAQTAAGLYKDDNLPDRIRGGTRIFSVMVTWTLENGIITADSMAGRGYGTGRRTRFSIFRWTRDDVLLLISTLLLTACAVWGMSGRTVTYYPAVAFAPVTARVLAGYIAYGCLTWLPAIITGKEAVKWHCLRSGV